MNNIWIDPLHKKIKRKRWAHINSYHPLQGRFAAILVRATYQSPPNNKETKTTTYHPPTRKTLRFRAEPRLRIEGKTKNTYRSTSRTKNRHFPFRRNRKTPLPLPWPQPQTATKTKGPTTSTHSKAPTPRRGALGGWGPGVRRQAEGGATAQHKQDILVRGHEIQAQKLDY